MSAFKDRIKNYKNQAETKVNPPEAQQVLEEKSAPEVANAPGASQETSTPATATSAESPKAEATSGQPASSTLITSEGKAKRGRPAGSKNAPKTPEPAPASEVTSPEVIAAAVTGSDLRSLIIALSKALPEGSSVMVRSFSGE